MMPGFLKKMGSCRFQISCKTPTIFNRIIHPRTFPVVRLCSVEGRSLLCDCYTQLLLTTILSNVQDLQPCGGLKAPAIAEGMTRPGDPVARSYGSDFFWSGKHSLAPEQQGGLQWLYLPWDILYNLTKLQDSSWFLKTVCCPVVASHHGTRLRFCPSCSSF
jgi:hypothetical protein